MKKNLKYGNVWYVILLYVVVPFVIIMLFWRFRKPLINYMSSLSVGGMEVCNSTDIVNRVYAPFISSGLFLLGLICTCVIVKCIDKIMDKNGSMFNVSAAEKIVFMVSVVAAVMAVVTLVYSKANTFDYSLYGIESKDMEEAMPFIGLQPIPSIRGGNMYSSDAPLLYRFIYHGSNVMKEIEENLDFCFTTIGAVLIPLKQKLRRYTIGK